MNGDIGTEVQEPGKAVESTNEFMTRISELGRRWQELSVQIHGGVESGDALEGEIWKTRFRERAELKAQIKSGAGRVVREASEQTLRKIGDVYLSKAVGQLRSGDLGMRMMHTIVAKARLALDPEFVRENLAQYIRFDTIGRDSGPGENERIATVVEISDLNKFQQPQPRVR